MAGFQTQVNRCRLKLSLQGTTKQHNYLIVNLNIGVGIIISMFLDNGYGDELRVRTDVCTLTDATIGVDAMFEAVQLPAGVAHLYAGLANVYTDAFSLNRKHIHLLHIVHRGYAFHGSLTIDSQTIVTRT